MSLTIERAQWSPPGHVRLVVKSKLARPVDWQTDGADAVALAGLLARAALEIDYTMRVQQREHRCVKGVRRYNDDLGELVNGYRNDDGCEVWLLGSTIDDDDPHLLRDGQLPSLLLTIPANRERSWRERIATALTRIAAENAATTTRAPLVVDHDA